LNGVEDLAKAGRVQSARGDIKVGPVEDIENLSSELDLGRFAQAEILESGKVAAFQSRTAQDVPPGIAGGKLARRAEG
jgi:hypothetical protein